MCAVSTTCDELRVMQDESLKKASWWGYHALASMWYKRGSSLLGKKYKEKKRRKKEEKKAFPIMRLLLKMGILHDEKAKNRTLKEVFCVIRKRTLSIQGNAYEMVVQVGGKHSVWNLTFLRQQ